MIGHRWKFKGIVVGLMVWLAGLAPIFAHAQQRGRLAKTEAQLVVEGVVRQVFRSVTQGRTDFLLQIEVLRSEGRKSSQGTVHLQFPGPGETVYVHISQRLDKAGRLIPGESHNGIPDPLSKVRAYLTPRLLGGWEGAFPDWFEMSGDQLAHTGPENASSRIADESSERTGKSSLGMSTEVIRVKNQIALRVTSVERGGAARESGLEVGDIIAGAEGAALKDAGQLEMLAAKGEKFSLVVVDVNTGRSAQIEIDPKEPPTADDEASTPPTDPSSKVSLGISAEPVALGSRSALKITRVDPAGPAAKAGLKQGDIVVAANGAPLTGPEQLLGALRKSGQSLKLTVRDSRTGRDAEISVLLGGSKTAKPLPAEVETPIATSPGGLGAVTELAFHDDDFAVKVTEIETDSPAARAGMRPGVMILTANGKPVLHPSELNDAVRKSGGTLKLTVFDPVTGKKKDLDVNLGR